MRLFIAINPEPSIRAGIFSATEPLRRILTDARWVAPELLHMTVKFLGNRSGEEAEHVALVLDQVAAGYRAMPYIINGVGAFPNLRKPGVVWIGVHGDAKLELINHDVERACAELGFPVEGKAFRPHITIGRIRGAGSESLRSFAQACDTITYQAASWLHSVDLMLSHHKDQRLTYSVLHSAPLAAR